MRFSDELIKFIEECTWIFAKTYASTWPHEYIVQEDVNNNLYIKLAEHIDTYGIAHERQIVDMLCMIFMKIWLANSR